MLSKSSGTIKKIDESSIRPLASAQVIFDLAAALKELIENSLDAHAQNISITLWEYGVDAFEVSDDGDGIEETDLLEGVGKRHYTSKLVIEPLFETEEMEKQLLKINTLGFRGEALHSLAILSEEMIVSSLAKRVAEGGMGVQINATQQLYHSSIDVNNNGGGIGTTVSMNQKIPMTRGTKVLIKGLLATLPVRLSDWRRNVKRYFIKAISTLQTYILAAPHVRFRVLHVIKTKRDLLLSSLGGGIVEKAYLEAFNGEVKSAGMLKKLLITLPEKHSSGIDSTEIYYSLDVTRKTGDRQFVFLDERPCEMPRLLKSLNQQFRENYCTSNTTLVMPILLVYLKRAKDQQGRILGMMDVNLSPDKKQIALIDEEGVVKHLVEAFRVAIGKERIVNLENMQPEQQFIPKNYHGHNNFSQPLSDSSTTQHNLSSEAASIFTFPSSPISELPVVNTPLVETNLPLFLPHTNETPINSWNGQITTCLDESIPCHPLQFQSVLYDTTITIKKDDFARMEVIGQFNCGFILTKLPDNKSEIRNVYIIDQHASDERYRLEMLERTLTFTIQRMLHPKLIKLEGGLQDEIVLGDNIDRLRECGFMINDDSSVTLCESPDILEDIPSLKTFYLTAAPSVVGIHLGEDDLKEAIHLIRMDEFKGLGSLSRVATILASRACRSAVMIGEVLNREEMTRIARNLGILDKPWICAHGRPTIRLLYREIP